VRTLSEGMTRICDGIVTLRQERERLLSGVRRETRDRKRDVSQMLAQFLNDFVEIAPRRADRIVFLSDLKEKVSDLRKKTREDLGGVREALASLGSSTPNAAVQINRRPESRNSCLVRGTPATEDERGGTMPTCSES
jgi:hypothetical protein